VQVEAETAAEAGMQVAKRDRELNDLPWVVTDTEVEATEVSVWEGVVPPEDKYGADTVLEGFGRAFYSRKEEGCSC
jgi:hypothetical protein